MTASPVLAAIGFLLCWYCTNAVAQRDSGGQSCVHSLPRHSPFPAATRPPLFAPLVLAKFARLTFTMGDDVGEGMGRAG